jgi:hypothetical protein
MAEDEASGGAPGGPAAAGGSTVRRGVAAARPATTADPVGAGGARWPGSVRPLGAIVVYDRFCTRAAA